ncbi:MAG: co-chaperone YbbN [Gammaproteobacteria bacterium]|nr:co-chaperone YbbN [Gammaproteobacteria bacterium]
MSNSPYIIDVTEENFEAVVIQGSMQQPVLVDFWAEWCNPCQTLIPIVSKLAEEYGGKFILAKINTEAQQQLAVQNGIKSLTTVKMFKGGQAVDEFMGALPEGDVRAFLDKHINAPGNPLYDQAMQAYTAGDTQTALTLLNQALAEDPSNATLKIDIANIVFQQGDFDSAKALIKSLDHEHQRQDEVKELLAQITLKERLSDAPDVAELEQRIEKDDADLEAHLQLSDVYAANGQAEQSLELLLHIMRKDRTFKDDAGRTGLINLFDILGADHPLTKAYRRKMFSLMH